MSDQQPPAPEAWGACPPPGGPGGPPGAPDSGRPIAPPRGGGNALHLLQRAVRKLIWLGIVSSGITLISF